MSERLSGIYFSITGISQMSVDLVIRDLAPLS